MSGTYRGKDGLLYSSREACTAADARYEQTRLMKEQNDLLKKQQQQADKARQQAAVQEAMERARQVQEARERQIVAVKEAVNDSVAGIISEHSTTMKEAGIGDPQAYLMKMIDVYKEDEEESKKINEILIRDTMSFKNMLKHIDNSAELMQKDNWGSDEEKTLRMKQIRGLIEEVRKKFWIPAGIVLLIALIFVIYGMIEGISYGFDDLFEEAGVFILCGCCLGVAILVICRGMLGEKVRESLVEYNRIIEEAYKNRESGKVIKLEKRRAENFILN